MSINWRCSVYTVYTAEFLAIAKALQICEVKEDSKNIIIFSDSKSD